MDLTQFMSSLEAELYKSCRDSWNLIDEEAESFLPEYRGVATVQVNSVGQHSLMK